MTQPTISDLLIGFVFFFIAIPAFFSIVFLILKSWLRGFGIVLMSLISAGYAIYFLGLLFEYGTPKGQAGLVALVISWAIWFSPNEIHPKFHRWLRLRGVSKRP